MARKTILKDTRKFTFAHLEEKIQAGARKKDQSFVLKGIWKRFVREQDGFKVYAVDPDWVANNLSVTFNHGGHGLVHEFIPMDEIWIGTRHTKECGCGNSRPGQKVSDAWFESNIIHEIVEFKRMRKGMDYWHAHHLALDAEREAGLLKDPHSDYQ